MAQTKISELAAANALTGGELLEVSQLSATVTISGTNISAINSDNSYNHAGNGFITAGFAVGNSIRVQGFTGSVANNILTGRITALTAGKMTIGGADGNVIVDDAAGESVTITKWESKRATVSVLNGGLDLKYDKTGGQITGDVEIVGTGRRIRGKFDASGGTISSRTFFQSSQANSFTVIGVVPSGTGVGGYLQLYSKSDPDNSESINLSATDTLTTISNQRSGTGVDVPLVVNVGNGDRLRFETDGRILAVSPAGMGYGVGAGGTVIQATDKTTAVTLNRPSGTITTANSSVPAGAVATFIFNNSTIGIGDVLDVGLAENGASSDAWNVWSMCDVGRAYINIRNVSGAANAQILAINFELAKGATS